MKRRKWFQRKSRDDESLPMYNSYPEDKSSCWGNLFKKFFSSSDEDDWAWLKQEEKRVSLTLSTDLNFNLDEPLFGQSSRDEPLFGQSSRDEDSKPPQFYLHNFTSPPQNEKDPHPIHSPVPQTKIPDETLSCILDQSTSEESDSEEYYTPSSSDIKDLSELSDYRADLNQLQQEIDSFIQKQD